MSSWYQIIKILHLWMVISWFAGLFYLPRIFVNIALCDESSSDTSSSERQRLILMAKKLYRFMLPLAILTLISGFALWFIFSWQGMWLHVKVTLVFFLLLYHFYCGRILSTLQTAKSTRSNIWFRYFNEMPVLILLIVLVLVVFKP